MEGTEARPLEILLVDDSEDSRFLIQAFLKKTPSRIQIAEDGRIALERVQSARFDLILMDMQMPVMDGLEATRKIRAWERENDRSPTPVIALTASSLPEEIKNAMDAGCDLHLSKPVSKPALLAAILGFKSDGSNSSESNETPLARSGVFPDQFLAAFSFIGRIGRIQ
jgi:two-component system sensor histidine kinase/response regulator